ncbi:UNVERIFIED_CONTAM: protein NRT1/ PTR FAMILY 8.1 [Sesamum radiatum]|uniref:Protein NRT1/ PTR FAMILY 8.1 n=1 Tax=Sesamum radiatum TaxID=300843 RepID=A0AAW2RGG8_SESRA
MEVMTDEDKYTKDGTLDFRNNPANKKTTGAWKACPFILGMMFLTLSASVPGLRPTCYKKDECYATNSQTAVFSLALYLVALGSGGLKPCVSSYGADQFDDVDEVEKDHKSSFFNWLYFSLNIGVLIGCSIPVVIQENIGWGWGFGVSAVATAIAVAFFFSGTRVYRYKKPGGNPLTSLCQVLVASLRKYRVEVPSDKSILYKAADAEAAIVGSRKLDHTNQFRFLDKAAVEKESDHCKGSVNPWRLCTVTQVEELKWIIRLLPVLATGIVFNTVFGQ